MLQTKFIIDALRNGKFAWDFNERTEEKILAFMLNPSEPPPPEPEWSDEVSAVKHLTEENFASFLKTKKQALVMFYAPWCGHCKKAKPHFTNAAAEFENDPKVSFSAVDCTKLKGICDKYDVDGFPTIIYFSFGKNVKLYEGDRDFKGFIDFMKNPSDDSAGKHDPTESWKNVPGYEHVNLLDDSAFFEFIKTKPKVLVMFYAPWCGHCTHMKPAYAEAAGDLKRFLPGSYLAAVDATKCKKVAKKFKTNGFPTLKYFENGEFKFDYTHGRKREDLVEFMKNPTEKVQEKTEL